MEGMSPLERVTFALRHFEGRSIAEISQTVGIGNNAAKQHIFRAVRKLRLALAAHGVASESPHLTTTWSCITTKRTAPTS
jgi:DNA-directed RNA polymerase specialized sigma24 family protein